VLEGAHPRVVRIGDYQVDIVPRGDLVLLRNRDVPGVIGRVGTALAGAGINIWLFWQAEDDKSTDWLVHPGSGSVRGYAFDVFVNA